jgi:hypothetical protein
MVWYSSILISSLSYFNWIYDLWFGFTHRLGKAWSAFGAQDGIWHISTTGNKAIAYPADIMTGDRPEWIFNTESNHLIDTRAGLVGDDGFHHSEYIGGSLYENNVECHDITDFISSVRVFGAQPPIQVLVWAWAVKTGRDCLGWLGARRNEAFEARMLNREADEVVFQL